MAEARAFGADDHEAAAPPSAGHSAPHAGLPSAVVTPAAAYHRYHIAAKPAAEIVRHPSRFRVKVKKHRLALMVLKELLDPRVKLPVALSRPCVYGVYGRPIGGMAPIHSKCVGCLRCSTQYPEMITILPNPARMRLGDSYMKPDYVDTIIYEAGAGHVPVRGAGYRGAFGGEGWDGMWTDMSEIVRPTRDGIHGREFISTAVDLGEKPSFLRFDASGQVVGGVPRVVSLPVPFLFDAPPAGCNDAALARVLAEAARRVDTFAIVPVGRAVALQLDGDHLAPLVAPGELELLDRLPEAPRLVFLAGWDEGAFAKLRRRFPASLVGVRVRADHDVLALFTAGVRIVHLAADYHGRAGERFVIDLFQAAHRRLLEAGVREEITLVGSGGVVLAEHVPKAIICGLDAVALDTALWVALQARLDGEVVDRQTARLSFPRLPLEWGAQRLANLAGSWRDQLLEVMGAMGLREVRRLRGELGRCMFQAELEREAFGEIHARAEKQKVTAGIWPAVREEKDQTLVAASTSAALPPTEVVPALTGGAHSLPAGASTEQQIVAKHTSAIHRGFALLPSLGLGRPPALGDARWTSDLILATWQQAATGRPPENGLEYRVGRSGGGFDRLDFAFLPRDRWVPEGEPIDTTIPLNRRRHDRRVEIPVPWYGAGMSFGSVSERVMLSRALNAKTWRTFTSTGEGGYPASLLPLAAHVITQVATGMFGVREETIQAAPIVEFKYAQGAKPGLGGHLLGDKATTVVAQMRESVPWVSLFSPFPFHSVYSVEDHKKHIDWIKTVNAGALVSVKVSTPTDVDMVAVGSYYAGAHIIHIDGGYGGTGAAPEIAKKNIAMPIELAIPKVHRFLLAEGIRDEVVLMASGGIRTAWDVAKAIALGADGVILGTSELVALGCTRCSNCERGRGCPFGLTTTDPELQQFVEPEWGAARLDNLYRSFQWQLTAILRRLGLGSVRELRGRTELLVYQDREERR
ncbi:MAG: glutamate synthase-related protein [Thermoanaerobaculales bacterium]